MVRFLFVLFLFVAAPQGLSYLSNLIRSKVRSKYSLNVISSAEDRVLKPSLGDYVTVNITALTSEEVTASVPYDLGVVKFVINGGGFTPEIHVAVDGMTLGDQKEILVKGETYNDLLAADVPSNRLPPGLVDGDILKLSNGLKARVISVSQDFVRLDANSRLAGLEYNLRLNLIDRHPLGYLQEVVFGAGCFWGVELAFQRVYGVCFTSVGYTQGDVNNPTYEEVCSGETGHVEAVRVLYDPNIVSFSSLLELFFQRHDPTQADGQGNDLGSQYRSGIYYTTESQREEAYKYLKQEQLKYQYPIVTEIKPMNGSIFWEAEDYHQRYLEKGGQSSKKNATETIRCYG